MSAKAALSILICAVVLWSVTWSVAVADEPVAPRHSSRMRQATLDSGARLQSPQLRQDSRLVPPSDRAAGPRPAEATPAAGSVHIYLESNSLYFHMTNPETPDPVTVSGRLEGKHQTYRLGLKLPPAEDDFALPWVEGPESAESAPAIPFSWQLRYRPPEGQWTGWLQPVTDDGPGLSQRYFWWVLDQGSSLYEFELRCAIAPESFQPPGHYARSVSIKILPGWGGS